MNYKPQIVEHIMIGNTLRLLKSNEKLVHLHWWTNNSTAKAVIDHATNAAYQVTTGKTFKTIGIQFYTSVIGTMTLYQGDTSAATTTTKLSYVTFAKSVVVNDSLNFEIASEKFFTIKYSTTSDIFVAVTGVET